MNGLRETFEHQEKALNQHGVAHVHSSYAAPESWFFYILNSLVNKINKALYEDGAFEMRQLAVREFTRVTPHLIPMLRQLLFKTAQEATSTAGQERLRDLIRVIDKELAQLDKAVPPEMVLPVIQEYKIELIAQLAKTRKLGIRAHKTQPGLNPKLAPLLGMNDILGVGYGAKLVNGIPCGNKPAIRVYVPVKKPKNKLGANELIPAAVNGILTDVIAIGQISVCTGMPPLQCGSGVGPSIACVGTAGCLVERVGEPGRRFILSCAHVLAASPPYLIKGNTIFYYPTKTAQNNNAVPIAHLEEWTTPGATDQVDAAIAELIIPISFAAEILSVGEIRNPPIDACLDQFVVKYGFGTGHTLGVIQDISVSVKVKLTAPTTETIIFHDELAIECENIPHQPSFSSHGDSGSLIVHATRKNPVGLLFASSEKRITFAHKIVPVLDRLGVKIL